MKDETSAFMKCGCGAHIGVTINGYHVCGDTACGRVYSQSEFQNRRNGMKALSEASRALVDQILKEKPASAELTQAAIAYRREIGKLLSEPRETA